nr:MAG TPA: hypothetical protein [Caudoviricetes sp.]
MIRESEDLFHFLFVRNFKKYVNRSDRNGRTT